LQCRGVNLSVIGDEIIRRDGDQARDYGCFALASNLQHLS